MIFFIKKEKKKEKAIIGGYFCLEWFISGAGEVVHDVWQQLGVVLTFQAQELGVSPHTVATDHTGLLTSKLTEMKGNEKFLGCPGHVASGYCIGWLEYRTCPSVQKVLLASERLGDLHLLFLENVKISTPSHTPT